MKPRQKRDRKQARLDFDRPIGLFSSLKMELSVLIVIATSIAFVLVWFLLKYGWSGWIAMPLTMIVALGITYFFSRGLIAPLRQLRDAAEAMSEGDYSVRVHVATNSNDEIGQLARTFNEMNIERFCLHDFLDETIEPLEIADAGHAHDIMLHVDSDIWMEGDQDRLRQLFTNIIANALKHSADGTSVLIEARENADTGTIVTNVVNFGSQIPAEERSDIFRRFVKGRSGPGTESGGTGIGLSIARWAAQLHGGTVRVVDDPRGADFEIVLPKYHIADGEPATDGSARALL